MTVIDTFETTYTVAINVQSVALNPDCYACKVFANSSMPGEKPFEWEGITDPESLRKIKLGQFEGLRPWSPKNWSPAEFAVFYIRPEGREFIRKWGSPTKSSDVYTLLDNRKLVVEVPDLFEKLKSGEWRLDDVMFGQWRTGNLLNADGSTVIQAVRMMQSEVDAGLSAFPLIDRLRSALSDSLLGPVSNDENLSSGLILTPRGEIFWRPNENSWKSFSNILELKALKATLIATLKTALEADKEKFIATSHGRI